METTPPDSRPLPPGQAYTLLRRGDWSFCTMEHTLIGPVSIEAAGAPFHHVTLPRGRRPRLGMRAEGRELRPSFGHDEILVIEAGAGGAVWWDDPFESACFYFAPAALQAVLGADIRIDHDALRSTAGLRAPVAVCLLNALLADAEAGQPNGKLVGDAIFTALAAQFAKADGASAAPVVIDGRIQRAMDYIHSHLSEPLTLPAIATASGASPFHLSRCFRAATGFTIWGYVLAQRARRAATLMTDPNLTLSAIAYSAGFESYSSFFTAIGREFRTTPKALRAAIRGR